MKDKLTKFGLTLAINTHLDGVRSVYLFEQVIPQLKVDERGYILSREIEKLIIVLRIIVPRAPDKIDGVKFQNMLDFLNNY